MKIVIDLQSLQTQSRFRGIGRYSLALTKAIIKNKKDHEIVIALSNLFPDTIEEIKEEFKELLPKQNIKIWNAISPTKECEEENKPNRKTSQLLREIFLSNLKPDIILISSLFEGYIDDAVLSIQEYKTKIPTATILYDLIPFISPQKYLSHKPTSLWYYNKIDMLKKSNALLSISNSAKKEAIDYLNFNENSITNISTAVDTTIFKKVEVPSSFKEKYNITKPFLMHTSAYEPRKNFIELIEAFAQIKKEVREKYQLVFVCKLSPEQEIELYDIAKKNNLSKDELILTGFIPDEDLVLFYSSCHLFVFPSQHEGFGLPVLEAMCCGAAVIGSNTSSIPEVIELKEALFDPFNIESISSKIYEALTNQEFYEKLLENSKIQSAKFSWDKSAKIAIEALEKTVLKSTNDLKQLQNQTKKKLAYFSPLPPQKSGISEYSKELLPYLSDYYDITLIVEQKECENLYKDIKFEIQSPNWYKENKNIFDRVLFHFGNSTLHLYMMEAIKEKNAVVVLHDFFLSAVYAHEELNSNKNNFWSNELYNSHGYKALQKRFSEQTDENTLLEFPCNFDILKNATGVIVHSSYSKKLFEDFYEKSNRQIWTHIPLLREEVSKNIEIFKQKDDFIISSFGFLDNSKQNHILLEAFISSKLSKIKECKLIFVGESSNPQYLKELKVKIKKHSLEDRVTITGWTDNQTFSNYLATTNIAVQLRTKSRGETSAAVLDCMNYEIPTITNANGSFGELDKNSVFMLEDNYTLKDLEIALETLYYDKNQRENLSKNAKKEIQTKHNPKICAKQYFEAIENSYKNSTIDKNIVIQNLSSLENLPKNDSDLFAISQAINYNFPDQLEQKQLLIDISTICKNDLKTGIERVVRAYLMEILKNPPKNYRVEPVYLNFEDNIWEYKYAREFTSKLLNIPNHILNDKKIDVSKDDIFFCPDFNRDAIIEASKTDIFEDYQNKGVFINFEVYDLLPISNPEFFPPQNKEPHLEWIKTICKYSNNIICISKDVEQKLKELILNEKIKTKQNQKISSVHLGADINSSAPTLGFPSNKKEIMEKLSSKPTFLIVSTIEPRKGHIQTIQSFEELWKTDDINLVIVGKEGWKGLEDEKRRTIPQIINKIKSHKELNKRLFWLENISDEFLEEIYKISTALIAPSQAEGFGLPLIEAAQSNIPIIARDIPVFKEVAKEFAYYFENTNEANVLCKAIKEWLELYKDDKHPKSQNMPWLTWQESTKILLDKILIP